VAGRFRDEQVTHYSFLSAADEVLVRCPRCDRRAVLVARPGQEAATFRVARRVVCAGCGYTTDEPAAAPQRGVVCDPFFNQALWLQAPVRGNLLWAYNIRHLDYLRSYVDATLRERPIPSPTGWIKRMTMAAKLPRWLTSAKNRADVLRAIDKLAATV
jgi:hypothetical protein